MRSAWHHEPREYLTDQEKGKLFFEQAGRCHLCTRKITAGEQWIVEHRLALENGGTNEWSNLCLTCCNCKPIKDASDHKQAGHNRRVATNHVVPKSERKTKGRPMPGSKASGLRKRMNGSVERR